MLQRLTIPDVWTYTPRRFVDERGSFTESYNAQTMAALGVHDVFVQDNHSVSAKKGTIRGLHFQLPPFAQAKLVRVLRGAIFDVAVDIRTGSPSYAKWVGRSLTAESGEQLYVPVGFAHGFCTLTDECELAYKVTAPYSADHDAGISWDDRTFAVAWPVHPGQAILSTKDAALPKLLTIAAQFEFAG